MLTKVLKRTRNVIYHFSYRLKKIPSSTYIQRNSIISKDLVIGEHSFVAPFCNIGAAVNIGDYVMIASHVKIVGGDHRFDLVGTPMIFSGREEVKETHLGDDVWIGAGATILAGVTIGDGSVVGAGAVVTKDIPPFSIVAGVPAKHIAKRFIGGDQKSHLASLKCKNFSVEYAKTRVRDE